MCIVLKGQDGVIEQARRQLEDLVGRAVEPFELEKAKTQVPVWAVLDYTNTLCVERELLLAKVSLLGPEFPAGSHHPHTEAARAVSPPPFVSAGVSQNPIQEPDNTAATGSSNSAEDLAARERFLAQQFETSHEELYPNRKQNVSAGDALIAKNLHFGAIKTLAEHWGGMIVDVGENSVIVQLTAKSRRIDAFLTLMKPFGILEAARSGGCRSFPLLA